MSYYKGLIDKYREYLPVDEFTPIVTLNEGNTPLIKADNLAQKLELDAEIYLKFEGSNPTGSFKDRGMTMAVTKAKEAGSNAIICASTGNTSASAAAYGARAGLKTYVLIPDGYIALGKLSQAMMYGAEIIAIQGNFDQALEVVRKISEEYPITLVNSVNPYRIEGQKTGAFEICDALGQAPDYHFIPVGNAGNITAYWKGYKEYNEKGIKPVIVSEVKCSQALYDTINETGGVAVMCKTGHGYIKSKMKETGAVLAGEMSGHTFFKDKYYGFDDAVYAGCRIIEIVAKKKKENPNFKIRELLAPFDALYCSSEVRLPCPNSLKAQTLEEFKKVIAETPDFFGTTIKDIITLDGMRIVFEKGFALIRQSNTEPVFTLRFEADSKDNAQKYEDLMVNKLLEIIKEISKA